MPITWTPDADTPKVFARLSGDHNPVHLDPDYARRAGFDTVIVHGMCVLGAAARAAQHHAPPQAMLRSLDVRFANPVLPDETLEFDGAAKVQGDGVKVGLTPRLPGDRKVMSPASFVFGPAAGGGADPTGVDAAPDIDDVEGEPFRFDDATIADYDRITRPEPGPVEPGIPPMVGMLGMTGALERAFRKVQPPERAGTWVHLRQSGVFYEPLAIDLDYVCRIQAGRNQVRTSKLGVMITIPFVVETLADRRLVSTGACGLLYAFEREGGQS